MNARGKFLIGSGIIIVTLVALAYVGYTQSKTYYHTISELPTLPVPRCTSACGFRATCATGSHHASRRPREFCPRRAG